jgi:hypothetical protein
VPPGRQRRPQAGSASPPAAHFLLAGSTSSAPSAGAAPLRAPAGVGAWSIDSQLSGSSGSGAEAKGVCSGGGLAAGARSAALGAGSAGLGASGRKVS